MHPKLSRPISWITNHLFLLSNSTHDNTHVCHFQQTIWNCLKVTEAKIKLSQPLHCWLSSFLGWAVSWVCVLYFACVIHVICNSAKVKQWHLNKLQVIIPPLNSCSAICLKSTLKNWTGAVSVKMRSIRTGFLYLVPVSPITLSQKTYFITQSNLIFTLKEQIPCIPVLIV